MADKLPEFWPSHLAKLLSGDQQCRAHVYNKAHFAAKEIKSDFDFKTWKADHQDLLSKRVKQLNAQGWKCEVESQNYFKLTGRTAVLPGKPDIVAKKDKKILVSDAKTGKPQDAHAIQVCLYMTALPMVWGRPNLYMEGEVCYSDHTVSVSMEMAESIKPKLFALLKDLGSEVRPEPIPSIGDCKYCQSADCPSRWKAESAPAQEVETEHF